MNDDVRELLTLLRNGAALLGIDEPHVNEFRRRSLDLAFHRFATCIVPVLVEKGLVVESVDLRNLVDVSLLFQNGAIRHHPFAPETKSTTSHPGVPRAT